MIVRDGMSASTLDLTNGNITYEPEQDVLWMAAGRAVGGEKDYRFVETKSMRKLKVSDTIRLIVRGSVTDVIDLSGALTTFAKQ